jgi:hypothetical protein
MWNKNIIKIVYDFIMLILVIMVYGVSATGILFHEIAGLIIFALFVIHLFYNRKWIIHASKKIIDKTFSKRIKTMYVVDILLFCMFILTGISGVLISKELFKFGYVYIWRYVHIISATICLILLGLHAGLHGNMIINTIKKYIHVPIVIGRTIGVIILITIFGVAIYGIKQNDNRKDKNVTVVKLIEDIFNPKESLGLDHANDQSKKEEHGIDKNKLGNEHNNFNGISILEISSGFLFVIILCSIVVDVIENRIRKKLRMKKAYCA